LISALLAPAGAPARVLRAWTDGAYELIVSTALLAECGRALAYPKLRARVDRHDAERFLDWLSRYATLVDDPHDAPSRVSDRDDDYLLALAAAENAHLVSGDKHLLVLADELPILPPARFLELIERASNDAQSAADVEAQGLQLRAVASYLPPGASRK
jgi:putative PIN family toxin of toxin-antitoxin system